MGECDGFPNVYKGELICSGEAILEMGDPDSLDRRLDRLEEHLAETRRALQWIIDDPALWRRNGPELPDWTK